MARLGASQGADASTFGGLAGVGDLVATASSKLSRNHQVGEKLAAGLPADQALDSVPFVAEGVPTTAAVFRRAISIGLHLPIVNAVHGVLYQSWTARHALDQLMALPIGDDLSTLRYR
jgi:glycerol-3-phosphate dehydrogenase (NAD(P)+)